MLVAEPRITACSSFFLWIRFLRTQMVQKKKKNTTKRAFKIMHLLIFRQAPASWIPIWPHPSKQLWKTIWLRSQSLNTTMKKNAFVTGKQEVPCLFGGSLMLVHRGHLCCMIKWGMLSLCAFIVRIMLVKYLIMASCSLVRTCLPALIWATIVSYWDGIIGKESERAYIWEDSGMESIHHQTKTSEPVISCLTIMFIVFLFL